MISKAVYFLRERVLFKATWDLLARVQSSIISQDFSALAISAVVISNVPDALYDLGVAPWAITSIYIGSILFLAGYVSFHLYAPMEFRGGGEIVDHVSRMLILSSESFIESRIKSAERLFQDLSSHSDSRIPRGPAESLKRTLAHFHGLSTEQRRLELPRLYQDDLAAREFIFPNRRLQAAIFFCSGAFLMTLPTLWNVARSLLRLLPDFANVD